MSSVSNPSFTYVGSELTLFENAVNWKRYWSAQIAPYIAGDVLEVGAGIGANTRLLTAPHKTSTPHQSWTCLEPDPMLASQIPAGSAVLGGTIQSVVGLFDTILYIDVLEHIDDDAAEMARAAAHLKPGGHLIVLSPAHAFLFTPFDAAIGHFRRYSRASLLEANSLAARLQVVRCDYLDSAGLLASLANRLLLRQAMPTETQVLTWDRLMIPCSRVLDPMTFGRLGKSVLGIWRRS